ncbi:MAG: gas vesicle protein GvpC [Syntrophomonadaceae bacterium]
MLINTSKDIIVDFVQCTIIKNTQQFLQQIISERSICFG